MDNKNYEYLSNKVTRYEQLQTLKEHLDDFQQDLIKDKDINVSISEVFVDGPYIADDVARKANCNHIKDEYEELMREIKDNLIDTIGMTIVKINQIMEEL
ncbi:hypothetical protein J2Z76_000473 [Sedimentibacter acidaminivorans]|uniref:Uncharacterized protein n=1 Tax=Sedimentibacter acidaminivorans TaxID=913099 RepID=A0ABS4GAA3_9FIRM|nr:hypothetical protein [Sedimentibacter acidaminivorans]MBP1924620.1 hypothetical protein [Sedimentibacter acidaminivorans]